MSQSHDRAERKIWRAANELSERWQAPVFPVSGNDLADIGVAKGPRVGELLAALEREWLARDFADGRDTLLARADEMIAANGDSESGEPT
jgi:tRNA nucleotidyltransferase/poly(A) polymerase